MMGILENLPELNITDDKMADFSLPQWPDIVPPKPSRFNFYFI